MLWTANHSIVVGKGDAARTIVAGQALPPDMPADEIKRLLALGAVGPQAPVDPLGHVGPQPEVFTRAALRA